MVAEKDGYITHGKFKTYYKIAGTTQDNGKYPVLILNGGPGSPHNYLLDLHMLAKSGRQVVFYDQLGSGLSSRPEDSSLWTVDTFTRQINTVREKLGLTNIHLLGHSWGGMLAIDYLLTQPTGIQGVILASTIISVPLFQREMNGLRRKLPIKTQLTLKKHEKAGTIDDPEYMAAYKVFQKKHIFRQDTWPPHLAPPEGSFGTTVYRTMWGYSECCPNGSLTQWDRIGRLHEITAPTLITSGRYDEVTPSQAATTRQEIAGSRQELFEYSAHMAHIEEVGKYLEVTGSFLDATEQH